MSGRTLCILFVALASTTATAETLEKPIYGRFDGIPLDRSPIISRMQFGTLPDGRPALEKVDEHTVRIHLTMQIVNSLYYGVEDVACSKAPR